MREERRRRKEILTLCMMRNDGWIWYGMVGNGNGFGQGIDFSDGVSCYFLS